jgi:hypothetical protein
LFAASGTMAQAADVDLQSLQQQINQLQQQLKDMQAKQAAAPAVATPTKNPYDVSMTDPSRGAFVIPGTNTTLHVGGFIDLQTTYDTGSSIGPAGYAQLAGFNGRSYVNNAAGGVANNGNIALPGTPFAKATGRFQMDPRFSRFNVETDTPSEYGDIGTVLEFDLDGDGLSANQKSTYSVSPRLRRAFVTFGNWVVGQTFQLTYDGPTNVGSIDNNSYMGQESGNRFPQIQYRWNIDAAQKHQLYFSLEAPYSDTSGIAPSDFQAGGQMAYQTDAVEHYPDISAKYVENGAWGRFFAAGVIHNIEVNTDGVPGGTAFTSTAASAYTQAIHTNVWTGFLDAGAKVYTTLGDPRNAFLANVEWGPAGARNANYSGGNSAVIGTDGKLHTQQTAGFDVGYQHFYSDHWVSNFNYGLQRQWSKTAYQNTQGLWKQGQEAEVNLFWMPTSYVNFGVAWIWAAEAAIQGQCLTTAGGTFNAATGQAACAAGALEPGAASLLSGAAAYDNRIEFRTRVNF